MKVTTLPWIVHGPLGHERGHVVALLEKDLGERLEQAGPVGGRNTVCRCQCRFPDTGSGFAVQALEIAFKVGRQLHQFGKGLTMGRRPQNGIAEVPRGQCGQVGVALGSNRMRCFAEDEELILKTGLEREA